MGHDGRGLSQLAERLMRGPRVPPACAGVVLEVLMGTGPRDPASLKVLLLWVLRQNPATASYAWLMSDAVRPLVDGRVALVALSSVPASRDFVQFLMFCTEQRIFLPPQRVSAILEGLGAEECEHVTPEWMDRFHERGYRLSRALYVRRVLALEGFSGACVALRCLLDRGGALEEPGVLPAAQGLLRSALERRDLDRGWWIVKGLYGPAADYPAVLRQALPPGTLLTQPTSKLVCVDAALALLECSHLRATPHWCQQAELGYLLAVDFEGARRVRVLMSNSGYRSAPIDALQRVLSIWARRVWPK